MQKCQGNSQSQAYLGLPPLVRKFYMWAKRVVFHLSLDCRHSLAHLRRGACASPLQLHLATFEISNEHWSSLSWIMPFLCVCMFVSATS